MHLLSSLFDVREKPGHCKERCCVDVPRDVEAGLASRFTGGLEMESADARDHRLSNLSAPRPAARANRRADVAELADALDLGSSAARRGGSSPLIRTTLLHPGRFAGRVQPPLESARPW
jgi:hypothetical protein